jgi:hypothetical protein
MPRNPRRGQIGAIETGSSPLTMMASVSGDPVPLAAGLVHGT